MIESTRKLTAIKYAATLVGALAVVVLAPATAHALPVKNNEGAEILPGRSDECNADRGCMLLFARVCRDHSVHSHGHWSAPREESRISPRTPAIASRGQYFPLPGLKLGAMTSPQFRM